MSFRASACERTLYMSDSETLRLREKQAHIHATFTSHEKEEQASSVVRTCPATIVFVRSWRGRYRRLAVADGSLAGAFEDLTQSLFATKGCSFERIVRGEVAYLLCQCHGNTQSTIRVSSRTASTCESYFSQRNQEFRSSRRTHSLKS